MVTLNVSIDDGDGYIHLISSCMTLNNSGYPTKHDGLVALCGHDIPIDATLCYARNAGGAIWKGQAFKPDDLAQVIIRLRQDGYMCRECVREHFRRVGGIPGLFHDHWTEDLHTDHGEVHVSAGKQWVEVETFGGVTVAYDAEADDPAETITVREPCPACADPLEVEAIRQVGSVHGHEVSVYVGCQSCHWSFNGLVPVNPEPP